MKYLIVGLGNIGPEYAFTRHNAGFMVLDRLAHQEGFEFTFEKLAYTATHKYKGRTIHFIKPTTYMNLSGKALSYYQKQWQVPLENVLVIVDELQLPFGSIKLKPKGSDGGHNGLKHIQDTLGTTQYARLRFGIGNDFSKGRQVDYVLGKFDSKETELLPELLDKSGDMVLGFCTIGLQHTMNQFNQ